MTEVRDCLLRPSRPIGLQVSVIAAALTLVSLIGCSDQGDPPAMLQPEATDVLLDELVPVRTFAGDTLRIVGSGFGEAPEGRSVLFTGEDSATLAALDVVSWSENEIKVLVPARAVSGEVIVDDNGASSGGIFFDVAPAEISFSNVLTPIFRARGCESCHFGSSGNAGFSVLTPTEILTGGSNGAAAVSRRAAESLIILKLIDPPFGSQMPQGSPPLPDEEILVISDWINQGARDN